MITNRRGQVSGRADGRPTQATTRSGSSSIAARSRRNPAPVAPSARVAGEGEPENPPHREFAAHRADLLGRRTHRQNGCLRRVDDGGKLLDPVHAEVGQGEGGTAHVLGPELAVPSSRRLPLARFRDLRDAERAARTGSPPRRRRAPGGAGAAPCRRRRRSPGLARSAEATACTIRSLTLTLELPAVASEAFRLSRKVVYVVYSSGYTT